MKWVGLACLVLSAMIVESRFAMQYWLGYAESITAFDWATPFPLLYAEGILFLTLICLLCTAVSHSKDRVWLLVFLVSFVPLQVLLLSLNPRTSLIAKGLHDRVMHDYSPEDLRRFAHEVDGAGIADGGWITRGQVPKGKMAQYAALRSKYPFLDWLRDHRGFGGATVTNYGQSDYVIFEWGGALSGHWGCAIRLDGKVTEFEGERGTQFLHATDDICFFVSPD